MYWAFGTRVTDVAGKMSRKRFFAIRSALKLVTDNDVSSDVRAKDKYWKIRPLLNTVRAGCLQNPRTQKVSIDEQMIPFWGKTTMRQYIRGKPNPFGLKNFVSTSPDGLPLDFFMYEGKGDSILEGYDYLNIGGKVVMRLATTLPEGSIIYMDRYFTSVELLDCPHSDRGCQATGTIQSCKVPSLSDLQTDTEMKKAGRGAADQSVRGDGQIAVIKWYDNKSVIVASSAEGKLPLGRCRRWSKQDKQYVNISRPLAIEKYNENMGGVDMLDRIIAVYRQSARSRKWTVRMILHLFDFACAAAWIEYRRDCNALKKRRKNTMDYLQFKIDVSEWLIHSGNDISDINDESTDGDKEVDIAPSSLKRKSIPAPIPSDAKRKSSAIHMPEVTNDEKTLHCRRPGCKSLRARVFCTECKLHLCLMKGSNCFRDFHTN
ncbi:piggyBac transposable element-derived protein 3-like [Schistocerca cancellata]|uniref:piggyBac transposable element-derived protein 3-like n=1 Tax=Schistocerca cancellata TaxID=274614 RepID=UPI0021199731|nr:piggyBac transposable element-derived protein 3-like [Schistocerca cancellata]